MWDLGNILDNTVADPGEGPRPLSCDINQGRNKVRKSGGGGGQLWIASFQVGPQIFEEKICHYSEVQWVEQI